MAKKNKLPQTFINYPLALRGDVTLYMYSLLLYVEDMKRSKNTTGFNVKNKLVNAFLESHGIKLICEKESNPHNDKNTIRFRSHNSQCWDMLIHIRNAFAHGTLTKDKNSYLLIDSYKGKYTMYGHLNSSLMIELIDTIVKNRK